jgi:N6-L-threonylcarbamoyladenine synthase
MGLPYPGGPLVDKLAKEGNPDAFKFSKPQIEGFNYSFSGLKTSFLYKLRDELKIDSNFIENNKVDLCASLQKTIIDILMDKLIKASKELKIKHIALAGGVSANSGLRDAFHEASKKYGWDIYIPKFAYTTDNAAMIAMTGHFKYIDRIFTSLDAAPFSRVSVV